MTQTEWSIPALAGWFGLFLIASAALSLRLGRVISPWRENGSSFTLIFRDHRPAAFRKAVVVQAIIGLLFMALWFAGGHCNFFT